MWFSRIWIALMAATAAFALAIATLAPKPASRELQSAHSYKLDLVQHNTHMVLKLQARKLIDHVTDLARDDRLVGFLDQAAAKQAKFDVLKSQMNARLLQLLSQYKKSERPELFIATDYRGKQIGRVGPGEDFKPGIDGIGGYPVVSAALRGYLRDDTWSLDGQLYFVAAAPVLSRAKDRYIGAVVLGQQVDGPFAGELKKQLVAANVPFLAKTEIAFYLRGKLLSASEKSPALALLPRRYTAKKSKVLKVGRSAAFFAGPEGKRRVIVVAPVPGGAVPHGAFYAVVAPTTRPLTLMATLDKLQGNDVGVGTWLLAAGVFVGLMVIALVLFQIEGPRPLQALVTDVRKIVKNDISRLADHRFSGGHRTLAKLVNDLIDRAATAAKRGAGKDIEKILDHGEAGATRLDTGGGGGGMVDNLALDGAMPPLAGDSPSLGMMASAGVDMGSAVGQIDELPSPAAGVTPLAGLDPEEAPTVEANQFTGSGALHSDALPVLSPMELPPDAGESPDFMLPGPDGGGMPMDGLQAQVPSLEVKVTAQGPMAAQSYPETSGLDTVIDSPRSADLPQVAPMQFADPEPEDPQAAYFQQIFDEFVSIKKSCGENTDNITYERFSAKLQKNRDSLMGRYDCSDVKFRVYIKDGKAALKATPITD